MLYGVNVRVNGYRNLPWMLVSRNIYSVDGEPLILVKSDLTKIEKEVRKVMKPGKNKKVRVWAKGQGIREVALEKVKKMILVQLNVGSINATVFPFEKE